MNYPAGTEDVTTTYHADGAVASVGAGAATIEYGYNRRRLLTSERLLWNSIDWLIGHGYSANGHEATLTYRDGARDHLGQRRALKARQHRVTPGARSHAAAATDRHLEGQWRTGVGSATRSPRKEHSEARMRRDFIGESNDV